MKINYEYNFKMPQDYKSSGAGDVEQDFLNSHYISNYHWIFSKLQQGQKGYVKKRE